MCAVHTGLKGCGAHCAFAHCTTIMGKVSSASLPVSQLQLHLSQVAAAETLFVYFGDGAINTDVRVGGRAVIANCWPLAHAPSPA